MIISKDPLLLMKGLLSDSLHATGICQYHLKYNVIENEYEGHV